MSYLNQLCSLLVVCFNFFPPTSVSRVDIRGGEQETVTLVPLFSEMLWAPLESFTLVLFSVIDQISHFSHDVRKGRLVKNQGDCFSSASFNTITKQMIERSHEK